MAPSIPQKNNEIYLSPNSPDKQHLEVHKKDDKKDKNQGQPVDAILLAYMLIYESVITSHDTTAIQAKQLEYNGNIQAQLIRKEQGFNFDVLDASKLQKEVLAEAEFEDPCGYALVDYAILKGHLDGTKKSAVLAAFAKGCQSMIAMVIGRYQMRNQEVSYIRGTFEDKLNVSRQTAQVAETNLNTVLNESARSIQQGGSVMQMLVSLTNQISRI